MMRVRRLSVAYIGPKSSTERPRKTKIGIEVAHVTRDSDITFKVKRSKVNLQGREHIVAASHTACLERGKYIILQWLLLLSSCRFLACWLLTSFSWSSSQIRLPMFQRRRLLLRATATALKPCIKAVSHRLQCGDTFSY